MPRRHRRRWCEHWSGGFFTGADSATTLSSNSATGAKATVAAPVDKTAEQCAALAGYATPDAQATSVCDRFARIPDAPTLVQTR